MNRILALPSLIALLMVPLTTPAGAVDDPYAEQYEEGKQRGVADMNLRDCFHRAQGKPCGKRDNLPYPQLFDNCNGRGKCAAGAKKPIAGCYNHNFTRISDIPFEGKCEKKEAPFRVELKYSVKCPNELFECVSTGEIAVRVHLFNDGDPDLPRGNAANEIFRDLSDLPIIISSNQNGDPVRVACAALRPSGYVWNATSGKCERPKPILCQQVLGLKWLNNQCLYQNLDCETQFSDRLDQLCPATETASYCMNYRYAAKHFAPGACLCRGTNAAQDGADGLGRSCTGDFSVFYYEDAKQSTKQQDVKVYVGGVPGA